MTVQVRISKNTDHNKVRLTFALCRILRIKVRGGVESWHRFQVGLLTEVTKHLRNVPMFGIHLWLLCFLWFTPLVAFLAFTIFCLLILLMICPMKILTRPRDDISIFCTFLIMTCAHVSLKVDSAKIVSLLTDLNFSRNICTCTHLFSIISVMTDSLVSVHCSFGLISSPILLADTASLASRSPHLTAFSVSVVVVLGYICRHNYFQALGNIINAHTSVIF